MSFVEDKVRISPSRGRHFIFRNDKRTLEAFDDRQGLWINLNPRGNAAPIESEPRSHEESLHPKARFSSPFRAGARRGTLLGNFRKLVMKSGLLGMFKSNDIR
jgi:hypothetical protein